MIPMKLIQFSDLHLSATNETEYGFSVLEEIIEKAETLECAAILFCGDVFDTYADLVALRDKFIQKVSTFSGKVYFLPGNHESLRRKQKDSGFQIFDWGNQIICLDKLPYTIQYLNEEVELLSIPHSDTYADLLLTIPPKKQSSVRIGLAHATVIGMSFTGLKDEEEEEKVGYIDVSQLQNLECDYVAIGHIHSSRSQIFGSMEIAYAGSSRVWRSGELGKRKGYLLNISNGKVNRTDVILDKAGQYFEIVINLGLDGKPEKTAEMYLSSYSKYDWVRIRWAGVVESMVQKRIFHDELKTEWSHKFRRLEFDPDESDVQIEENLSDNAFIQNFVTLMDSKKTSMETSEWTRAKELGLKLLLEVSKR